MYSGSYKQHIDTGGEQKKRVRGAGSVGIMAELQSYRESEFYAEGKRVIEEFRVE